MELTKYLDEQVGTYRQTIEFMPFYKARLQQKEGPLPEFKVSFSNIVTVKPATEEKEFLQFLVKPSKNYSKIMALGSHLMDKLILLTVRHDKTMMDVTLARGNGKPFSAISNIELSPSCFVKAIHYYKVNEAIVDIIANALISAWEKDSTNFVVNITLHN